MKLVTQILILSITPLILVFGYNFYQSYRLKQTLESHIENTLKSEASVSMEHLLRQRTLARQIGKVLATSQVAIEALNMRDSVALHELGSRVVDSGLVDSVVFIDTNKYVAARSDELYHFNDPTQSHPLWDKVERERNFEGFIIFDGKSQLGVIVPIVRFQTNLVGYVLVTHFLDEAFMKSLNSGSAKAFLSPNEQWLPKVFTHHHFINLDIPSLSAKKYALHVWKDAKIEKSFIEGFYKEQNFIITIVMILFFALILWVANGITKPLRDLGLRLGEFADGKLTLHGLTHVLLAKKRGKSEISVLIEGVLVTLRTLALTHKSFESSKERALKSGEKTKKIIEETLGQLRTPLLALELHCEEKNQDTKTKEALHVMRTIIDKAQNRLYSNDTITSEACVMQVLIESIATSAKKQNVDLHIKGIDTLPEIVYLDEIRWGEFFEFMWVYLKDFLPTKPHVFMEWTYQDGSLNIAIDSPTHTRALHLLVTPTNEELGSLDASTYLHMRMLMYAGVHFNPTNSGILIYLPLIKTATIKAKTNQSPL